MDNETNENYANTLDAKIESGEQLNDWEINWLKTNGYYDIIYNLEKNEFKKLKSKYDLSEYRDKSPDSFLYQILKKLDKSERLDAKEIAMLEADYLFPPKSKLFIVHHQIEASFYEEEYKRNGIEWNLVKASKHLRLANQSMRALHLTENLPIEKIKEAKLKSALLTTRDGSFRDIENLDEAENCALKAISYYPGTYYPYTLMGGIYFDRGEYVKGYDWFTKAIELGGTDIRNTIDNEIKQIVKNEKDKNKQRDAAEYLLNKDPERYAWAKSYL